MADPATTETFHAARIPPRTWYVLEARFGRGTQRTLEEIGRDLGVTRERIRQVQAKGLRLLEQSLRSRLVRSTLERAEELLALNTRLKPSIDSAGQLLGLTDVDWQRVLLAMRGLTSSGRTAPVKRYPRLCLAACWLSPAVIAHPDVAREISRHRAAAAAARYKPTYIESATQALQGARGPLHWREIMALAELVGPDINPGPFFNVLVAHPDRFVRVGPGTYGLAEWNLTKVPTFVDLIARTLGDARRTMSSEQVFSRVTSERRARQHSIQMFLDMHPRFYRSVDGAYGLRAWLPPPSEQTLRTPRHLIEAANSRIRLERARDRGYDIEGLVARDVT